MPGNTNLLWLCKSRYMNHDVIGDRYARLFELPHYLGHYLPVRAFCLDYRKLRPSAIPADLETVWGRASVPGTLFIGWFFQLLRFARRARPAIVVASSDCVHVILGAMLAQFYGARFYADLYDDYSTFGLVRVPGIRWLYRRALARADGISAVSTTLARDLEKQYPGKPVLVLESTIPPDLFRPRDRDESRELLHLQDLAGKKLVGVCGGLNAGHGADIVFGAFEAISKLDPDARFVVAGKLNDECPLPERPDVRYLGMLPHAQMSSFYSAMDVVVVPLSNTAFGYYAFPQKAYEVLACGAALVAADVGALSLLFAGAPEVLYQADSPDSLAARVGEQLARPTRHAFRIPTWDDQARELARFVSA